MHVVHSVGFAFGGGFGYTYFTSYDAFQIEYSAFDKSTLMETFEMKVSSKLVSKCL